MNLTEKTEPAPLSQREMNQFIALATMPTLERALERLRWLEAENAALKAQPDPIAEMWRELAEYQEQADKEGHGDTWRAMCEDRQRLKAAFAAHRLQQATSHVAAAAYGAWWAAHWDASARRSSEEALRWAANAVDAIRLAKGER